MTHDNDAQSKALIPLPSRALSPAERWLPALASQKVALGVAASAAGSIFLKRLIELAADDVYRRVKRLCHRAATPSPAPANQPANARSQKATPAVGGQYALFVRIIRIERLHPPFRHRTETPREITLKR